MRRRLHRLVLASLSLAALTTTVGCAVTGPSTGPSPTASSVESVEQALARVQEPTDTPTRVPTNPADPRTLRRLAVVEPATWYIGRTLDGSQYCALGVWATGGGSLVSTARCVGQAEFTSASIQTSIGESDRQSRVWIAPDARAVRRPGWTVLGPSLLIPAAGPFASPTPTP